MKALSVRQPWATVCVLGVKRIETRSWATKHRGPLAIHAGQARMKRYEIGFNNACWTWHHALAAVGGTMGNCPGIDGLPYGALIGLVELLDCVRVEDLTLAQVHRPYHVYANGSGIYTEEGLGNYSAGRFGWLLGSPRMFAKPIPMKARLGLFDVDAEMVAEALAA